MELEGFGAGGKRDFLGLGFGGGGRLSSGELDGGGKALLEDGIVELWGNGRGGVEELHVAFFASREEEEDGLAGTTCSGCTPDSMNVVVDSEGRVVLDY